MVPHASSMAAPHVLPHGLTLTLTLGPYPITLTLTLGPYLFTLTLTLDRTPSPSPSPLTLIMANPMPCRTSPILLRPTPIAPIAPLAERRAPPTGLACEQCNNCGARRSVAPIKTGFVAISRGARKKNRA